MSVKKSRERAHLANAGEFNRRYLTCQISAILYADLGDRRKSPSLHRAHLAIFADHRDRRIKSPGESPAYSSKPIMLTNNLGLFLEEIGQTCRARTRRSDSISSLIWKKVSCMYVFSLILFVCLFFFSHFSFSFLFLFEIFCLR